MTALELERLVLDAGERVDEWADRVRHEPGRRVFEQLRLDEHVGVWLICWMPGHDTGFHDHDISSGALTVERGSLREERLRFEGPPASVFLEAGQSVHFGPSEIHRVVNEGDVPAVSIHAYSPPLMRMGSYIFSEDGALLREPIGPVEELRPLVA